MSFHNETGDRLRAQEGIESRQNHGGGSLQLFVPALVGRLHFDNAVRPEAHRTDAAERIADGNTPGQLELAL